MVALDRAMNVLLALAVIIASTVISTSYWEAHYAPPAKYLSIAVLTRIVKPGDPITYRVTIDRRENCPGYVDRSQVHVNGDERVIFRDQVQFRVSRLGEAINLIDTMPTPKDAPDGIYYLRMLTVHRCDKGTYSLIVPEASFRICRIDATCVD